MGGGKTEVVTQKQAEGTSTQSGQSGGTSSTSYPPWYNSALQGLFKAGKNAYKNIQDIGPYQGQFIADVDPRQREAVGLREDLARDLIGRNAGQDMLDYGGAVARGDYLHAESNPYLQSYIDATNRPIADYGERALEDASSAAVEQGAFGGSREAVLASRIAGETQENIADATSRITLPAYLAEREFMSNAPTYLDEATRYAQLPDQILYDVGASERGFEQTDLAEQQLQFEELINYETRGLNAYAMPFGAGGMIPSTTTSNAWNALTGGYTEQVAGAAPSRVSRGISGAMSGASIGAQTGSPYGALAGAIIGGALSQAG
jgi:hypothetical protein